MSNKFYDQFQDNFKKKPDEFLPLLPKFCFKIFTLGNWIILIITDANLENAFEEQIAKNHGGWIVVKNCDFERECQKV